MLSEELTSERFRRNANRRRNGRQSVLEVNVRISEQRAERFQRIAALSLLAVALTGVGALLLFGARQAGRTAFSENPFFTIRNLDVASDGRLSPSLVRDYAALRPGLNLFAVDIRSVRSNLARVPLVREVRVSRHLPDRLEVRISERTPLARVVKPGTTLSMAVDREGFVLGPSVAGPHLPLISGLKREAMLPGERLADPEVRDALELIDLCDRTRLCQFVTIREIRVDDPETLDLRLAGNEQVTLPRRNMDVKLQRLGAILKTIHGWRLQTDRPISIDMCSESNFPVTGIARSR